MTDPTRPTPPAPPGRGPSSSPWAAVAMLLILCGTLIIMTWLLVGGAR